MNPTDPLYPPLVVLCAAYVAAQCSPRSPWVGHRPRGPYHQQLTKLERTGLAKAGQVGGKKRWRACPLALQQLDREDLEEICGLWLASSRKLLSASRCNGLFYPGLHALGLQAARAAAILETTP